MTTHIHSEQGRGVWIYARYGHWCLADNMYHNGQWWWSWLSFSFLCHWQLWYHTLATKREEFEDMRDVDRVALGTIVAGAESQTGLGLGVTLRKPSLKRRPFRLNSWWDCAHRGIFLLWTFTFSIPLYRALWFLGILKDSWIFWEILRGNVSQRQYFLWIFKIILRSSI